MSGIIGGAGSKSGVIGETELDYEEGTFSCYWTDGSNTAGTTTCKYTKIGRQVTAEMRCSNATFSGWSNPVKMGGLPFVINQEGMGSTVLTRNINYSNTLVTYTTPNTNYLQLWSTVDNGQYASLNWSNITGVCDTYTCITYQTTATGS